MNRYEYFCSLVMESIDKNSVVVEIGAGIGLCRYVQSIRDTACRLIGVDPSPNVEKNPYMHNVIKAYFEESDIDSNSVDLIYSIYVVEHIENPEKVFSKAHTILKDGGKMFFITPNKFHYFVFFSRLADKINIKRLWIEKVMKSTIGLNFGFKSFYLVNDAEAIQSLAIHFGFKGCKLIYRDSPEDVAIFFPEGLKWVPFLISAIMKFFNFTQKYQSDLIAELIK